MSKENVDIVRAVIHAFNRRDLAALTESFDPEIEWTPVGPAAVEQPYTEAATRSRTGCRDLGGLGGVPPRGARGS